MRVVVRTSEGFFEISTENEAGLPAIICNGTNLAKMRAVDARMIAQALIAAAMEFENNERQEGLIKRMAAMHELSIALAGRRP